METTDQLQQLLRSLAPNERRYLSIHLAKDKSQGKMLQLLELTEQKEAKGDTWLAAQLALSRSALTNLKHQAYRTVLRYMRMYNESRSVDYQLREWTLNAYFLFDHRLYDQSLKELERAIEYADRHDRLAVLIELLALKAEIVIERNPAGLNQATQEIHRQLNDALGELELDLEMKELRERSFLFMRTRYQLRSDELRTELDTLFSNLPQRFDSSRLSYRHHRLYAEANRYACFNQFDKAAGLYEELLRAWDADESRRESDPLTYAKLLSNYSTALFSAGRFDALPAVLQRLRELPTHSTEEEAEQFQNTYYLELLTLMNTDGYDRLGPLVHEIGKGLHKYRTKINKARELSFYHNIAMAYFVLHDWKESLAWIERIISQERSEHRQDLQHAARMLRLVLWYELGKHDLLEYELVNVERFLRKRKAWFAYESTVVKFFGKLLAADEDDRPALIGKFRTRLAEAVEGKTSASLPGASELGCWVQSKMEHKTIREVAGQTA